MSIKDFLNKIKPFLGLIILALFMVILAGFVYIYLNNKSKEPVTITMSQTNDYSSEKVIGSKNGTKYYFPWCGGVDRIKPENRVEFASIVLARQNGYTPAKNCKGLK